MKTSIFSFLLSLLSLSLFSQETAMDCAKFREGAFQLTGKKSHIVIKREGNIQTETNIKTGDEFTYSIVWLDDCRLQLIPLSEEDKAFFKDKIFIAEIISTKENSYTSSAGFEGEKMKVVDEIIKIN